MKVSGCELLVRCLEMSGVRFVTGRGEGPLGPVFLAMQGSKDVTAITPLGDIAGAFMAAVVLCSTPAEAMNSLTGMGTAWADKVPLVALTVRSHGRSSRALPGQTQIQAFSAFSKWSKTVSAWEDLPATLGQAWREAMSGCHGPVHLEIAEEVLAQEKEVAAEELEGMLLSSFNTSPPATLEGDPAQVEKALRLLLGSERPLILSGGGVVHSEASREMDELARALQVPATTSMAGEGTVRGDNPFYIGGPSYVGGESFHRAIRRADCVMTIGAALGGLEGFGSPPFWGAHIRFIQVDIDPINICLNVPVELSILGDARAVILQMLELLRSGAVSPNPAHRAWLDHLLEVKRRWRARVEAEAHADWPIIHQGYLARTLAELAEPDTFFMIDGGNTALWAGMFCMPHLPRSALFAAGMGTLGCGIPTAIGIKAADPQRPLILIQGDGSFLYNVQELETARRLGMSFVVVIFNDGCWNMIKGAQDMFFGGRYVGAFLGDVDYAAVARGFGCYGKRVERVAEIAPAFREACESGLPAVLDVLVDPDTFPETLASFAVGEFGGVRFSLLRAAGRPKLPLDRRLLNRARYAFNILLDKDLR
jgi:thiamine pyrophosphate-dependent acetolactate synthase large subunit-like protein